MDGLHGEQGLLLGPSSFPLDGCEDGQAVGVGVQGAGGGDGEGGWGLRHAGQRAAVVSLRWSETRGASGLQVRPSVLCLG